MKICPTCGEVYADRTLRCHAHDIGLVDWEEASETRRGETTTDSHLGLITDVDGERVVTDPPFLHDEAFGEIAGASAPPRLVRPVGMRTPPVELAHGHSGGTPAPHGGRVLGGRYRLDEHIGVGGYGAVFSAIDENTGERVAVKVLSPAAAQDAELLTRFHREAIAAARSAHPHIVDVTDFDVDGGTHYIVMEYLDGVDLAEVRNREGALPPARALRIVAQCASGLAAAHREGILHRDLKPANVFLIDDGRGPDFVKIIDFGISKLTRAAGAYSDLTSASRVVGTPCYMSPEQARGEELDGRCDVYGLGIILFELLTGERPFNGRSSLDILNKHIAAPRFPPSLVRPELARFAGLDELVVMAIAADADDRYASMNAFRGSVVACLERIEPGASRDLDETRRLAAARGELSSDTTRVDGVPLRRRSGVVAIAATVAAVAAAIAVGFATSGGDEQPRSATAAPESTRAVAEPPSSANDAPPVARPPVSESRGSDAPPVTEPQPAPAAPEPAPVEPEPALVPHDVRVTTAPAGAYIVVDGQRLGVTPMTITLASDEVSRTLYLRARGRRGRTVVVDRDRDQIHVNLPKRGPTPSKPTSPGKGPELGPEMGIEEW